MNLGRNDSELVKSTPRASRAALLTLGGGQNPGDFGPPKSQPQILGPRCRAGGDEFPNPGVFLGGKTPIQPL